MTDRERRERDSFWIFVAFLAGAVTLIATFLVVWLLA